MMDRKAKIKAYKEMVPDMGIYQIKNTENGKLFIGSSIDLRAIMNRHRAELKMGSHRNKELQKDWKTFGADSFEFSHLEILEPLDDPYYSPLDDLKELEKMWFEKLQPVGENGYHKR